VDPVKYPHGDVERSATLVLYLTDGFEGGETVFPRVKTPGSAGKVSVCIGSVQPRADRRVARGAAEQGLLQQVNKVDDAEWANFGSLEEFCDPARGSDVLRANPGKGGAILFFDYTPDGKRDMDTVHGSCPVRVGTKVIAQQWVQLNFAYSSAATLEARLERLGRGPSPAAIPPNTRKGPKAIEPPPRRRSSDVLPPPTLVPGAAKQPAAEPKGKAGKQRDRAGHDPREGAGAGAEPLVDSGRDAVATLVTTSDYALAAVALAKSVRAVPPSSSKLATLYCLCTSGRKDAPFADRLTHGALRAHRCLHSCILSRWWPLTGWAARSRRAAPSRGSPQRDGR